MMGKRVSEHRYRPGWPAWPAWIAAFVLLLPLISLIAGNRESADVVLAPPVVPAAPAADAQTAFNGWPFAASLAVSAAAACLALVIGRLVAAALELTDLPGRGLWATAMLISFASPSAAWALAQVYCYGASGLVDRWLGDRWRPWLAWLDTGHYASTTIVLGEIYAPLAMLLIGRGLSRLPHSGWEAARLMLPPARRWRWVAGAVRCEASAAWLLAFALALGNFAVPHVLQCRLFPIDVYLRLTNYLDVAGASRSALALLAAAVFAVVVLAFVERGRVYSASAAAESQPVELGWRVWPVGGVLLAYLAIAALLPLAAIVAECRSPEKFLNAVRDAAPETANTLRDAASAAVLALLAGAVVGRAAARKTSFMLELASVLPVGVPALVLAMAYSLFFNQQSVIDLRAVGDTSALVVLAWTAHAWPFTARAMLSAERRISPTCHEAAWLSDIGRRRRAWWIGGPLLASPALAAALIAYLLSVGDVEISQLLCAPGQGTLALRLFTFMHFGPVHVAASLALLQLAVSLLPLAAYFLLTNRCLQVV